MSTITNLFMFAIGVGLLVVLYKKYKDTQLANGIIEPGNEEFPGPFYGKTINEMERVGSEDPTVQRRRIIAINSVAQMVMNISQLPVDPFKVREELDALSRLKDHSNCPAETVYDIINTLIFDTNIDPHLGKSLDAFDRLSLQGAKAYILWDGRVARIPINDIC